VRINNRIIVLLLCLAVSQSAFSKESLSSKQSQCQVAPSILLSMPIATAHVKAKDGEKETPISYRVAGTDKYQAFGFQYACPETINSNQILFVFDYSYIPQFHMRNVFAALDIAFIDKTGKIVNVQQMQPYNSSTERVLYSPKVKVKYALEAREGYFNEHGITVGDQLLFKHFID